MLFLGLTPKNGGQVVKELLKENGCNLTRFNKIPTESDTIEVDNFRIRRKKRR